MHAEFRQRAFTHFLTNTIIQDIRICHVLYRQSGPTVDDIARTYTHTGLPRHISMNNIICCQGVNELISTGARPPIVIAPTQSSNESMYDILNLPLQAYNTTERTSGMKVLIINMQIVRIVSDKYRPW